MSEPTKLDYTPGDFDDPARHRSVIQGDPTYAYHPMPPFDQRFPPIRKKAAVSTPNWDAGTKTYLIGAEGSRLTKIGKSDNPRARMETLQTGQPMTLSLLWTCDGYYEGKLHRKFKPYRVRGEWFDLTPLGDPVEVVAAAVEEMKDAEAQAAEEQ